MGWNSSLATAATVWPTVPDPDDRWWWLWSSRWNENCQVKLSTRRKPGQVPLCPQQILHDLAWDRTWAAAVGARRLTAWAMARQLHIKLLLELAIDPCWACSASDRMTKQNASNVADSHNAARVCADGSKSEISSTCCNFQCKVL
jgi:hypothetical protein